MRQSGDVRRPDGRLGERVEQTAMELEAPRRTERLDDCLSRQLVPEGHALAAGHEHADEERFVELVDRIAAHALQEPRLHLGRGE